MNKECTEKERKRQKEERALPYSAEIIINLVDNCFFHLIIFSLFNKNMTICGAKSNSYLNPMP